jgi:hypothetical protein
VVEVWWKDQDDRDVKNVLWPSRSPVPRFGLRSATQPFRPQFRRPLHFRSIYSSQRCLTGRLCREQVTPVEFEAIQCFVGKEAERHVSRAVGSEPSVREAPVCTFTSSEHDERSLAPALLVSRPMDVYARTTLTVCYSLCYSRSSCWIFCTRTCRTP